MPQSTVAIKTADLSKSKTWEDAWNDYYKNKSDEEEIPQHVFHLKNEQINKITVSPDSPPNSFLMQTIATRRRLTRRMRNLATAAAVERAASNKQQAAAQRVAVRRSFILCC